MLLIRRFEIEVLCVFLIRRVLRYSCLLVYAICHVHHTAFIFWWYLWLMAEFGGGEYREAGFYVSEKWSVLKLIRGGMIFRRSISKSANFTLMQDRTLKESHRSWLALHTCNRCDSGYEIIVQTRTLETCCTQGLWWKQRSADIDQQRKCRLSSSLYDCFLLAKERMRIVDFFL